MLWLIDLNYHSGGSLFYNGVLRSLGATGTQPRGRTRARSTPPQSGTTKTKTAPPRWRQGRAPAAKPHTTQEFPPGRIYQRRERRKVYRPCGRTPGVSVRCTGRMNKMTNPLSHQVIAKLLQLPEMREALHEYAYGQDSAALSEYIREHVPTEQLLEMVTADELAEYAINHCRSELIYYITHNAAVDDSIVEVILDAILP